METEQSRAAAAVDAENAEDSPLTISPASVAYLILLAKEFAAKDVETEPDPGSNPIDDGMVEILEDHPDDLMDDEMRAYIDNIGHEEQIDLVALAWLGRDDYTAQDWPEVRQQAAEAHNDKTARYLLGMPLLANYLENGLDMLGYSVEELESDVLQPDR